MAEYIYSFQENGASFDAYVEDLQGRTIWQVHYPELIEDATTGDMIPLPTIFDEGHMKGSSDVEGLEHYLRMKGILQADDELLSEHKTKSQSIPNNYAGKSAETIWNELTENQRLHFLIDHAEELSNGMSTDRFTKIAEQDWDDLDFHVQIAFSTHKMMGQYAEGGETDYKEVIELTPIYTKRDSKGFRIYSTDNGNKLYAEKKGDIYEVDEDTLKPTFVIPIQRTRFKFVGLINDEDTLNLDPLHYERQSIQKVRKSFGMAEGGETDDDDDDEQDENETRLQELVEEYDIPEEVIKEFASDRGIEISEIDDLPFQGRFDSEEDYAEDAVEQGVVGNLSYYLYMTDTDKRILAGEEADARIENMDDDDLLSEADLDGEADEYDEMKDDIDKLEDEIDELKDELDDIYSEENEDTTEAEREENETKATDLRDELNEKESNLEDLQHKLASSDNRDELIERAKENLREQYYDDIYDQLDKDAVGYFTENLGYAEEDLAKNNLFSIDYEFLAKELGYDVLYIEHDGDVYVFSNSYARGGALETKLKSKLSESFELPMEVAVYVPSTEKANVIISKKEFTNRVEEVEKYLSNLFGGYSAVSVDGGYMSDEKGLIQEDVARVASFGGKDDFESKFNSLLRQVTKWGADWGQESMGLEFEGDMFYIDSNAKFKDGGMMAKGGVHKVNKNYQYFAVNKKTNKIVDGWEIVDDVESLKYYAKIDLKDNDYNPKDYNLLSAKTLKSRGIDPYSWDSWAKTDEYAKGGVTFDDKVQSISKSLLKRKKVSPSVQKDYGKTYSKKEAIESAKRIAGAMRKKEIGKRKK